MFMAEETLSLSGFEGVEIKSSKYGGLGVFAVKDLYPGHKVLRVRKSNVLSPKNSAFADVLEKYDDIGPSSLLIVAFIFERAMGKKSKWFNFIEQISSSLPDIPALWTHKEQSWLKGTNIKSWVPLDTTEIKERYNDAEEVIHKLTSKSGFDVSFEDWLKATLIVSSRAFDVDTYHELSLVPGACMFNHSDHESVHFETDLKPAGAAATPQTSPACERSISSNALEEFCELNVIRSIRKGNEVFNTYGDDPNGILLARYGFAVWNNSNDIVEFEQEVFELAKSAKVSKRFKAWLKEQERLEDSDNEASFVGLLNDQAQPRISSGLNSIAVIFGLTPTDLASCLAKARYAKYALNGSSEELRKKLDSAVSPRLASAITAVGTEKLMLEAFLA